MKKPTFTITINVTCPTDSCALDMMKDLFSGIEGTIFENYLLGMNLKRLFSGHAFDNDNGRNAL